MIVRAAVLLSIALFGAVSGLHLVAAAGALAVVVGRRVPIDLTVKAHLVVALAGLLLGALAGPTPLPGGAVILGMGGVTVAAARLLARSAAWGDNATLVPALLVVAAAGWTKAGPLYTIGMLLFVAASLFAIGAFRLRRELIFTAAVAIAIAAGASFALPPLQLAVIEYGFGLDVAPMMSMSGFGGQIRLGSMRNALESDKLVARVFGAHADHLRGAVYTRYEGDRWIAPDAERPKRLDAPPEEAGGAKQARVEVVGASRDPFFVPLEAEAVHARGGVTRDAFGVHRPEAATNGEVTFTLGRAQDLAPPGEEDLAVPDALRPELARIAAEWTRGATTARAKVEALEAKIERDFVYSLELRRPAGEDPLLHYLRTDHRGHCEYIASAMTLLSRSAGVPARMIGGFRVTEASSVGRYWFVRERDAHAWTEVWLDGRWTTSDPSPLRTDHERRVQASLLSSLGDALGVAASAAWSWLRARSTRDLALLGAVVLALYVATLAARRMRSRSPARPAASAAPDPAPECSAALHAAIARDLGLTRAPAEPLERFAARVEAHPSPRAGEAAALLRAYAAHRYGDEGTLPALATAIAAWARPS